jgi:tripartite-type tricarboxylate transporter receptor subunit TctC
MRSRVHPVRALIAPLLAILVLTAPEALFAAEYPDKPLTVIVPYAAGTTIDVAARAVTEPLAKLLGQPVLVENKAGGGGTLGIEVLAKAKPDGYTLLVTNNALLAVTPQLRRVGYDPIKDFVPVALVADSNMPFCVTASLPVTTVAEFVEHAKANPGKLSWGSAGVGTIGHLAGEYLKSRASIDIFHVPYKNDADLMVDIVAGDVQASFLTQTSEYVPSGKLKALAVLGNERWERIPDAPSMAESGYPNWETRSWFALIAPAGVPDDILNRLHEAVSEVVAQPETIERLRTVGVNGRVEPVEDLRRRVDDDIKVFGRLIKNAGIEFQN